MTSSKLVSYNCRGLSTDTARIRLKPNLFNLFCDESVDFICLQETFYTKQDLSLLNNIHSDFHAIGESTTDARSGLITGHPPGGIAIFWRKKYDQCVNALHFDADWIVGIEINIAQKRYVVLNVYMPCESREHADSFLNNLGKLHSIMEELDCTCVFIVGDFNADISDDKALFGTYLKKFCCESGLKLSSETLLPENTFTFLSDVWNTTSWLDHCVCTNDAHDAIRDIKVDYNGAVSDHFPLSLEISMAHVPALLNVNNNVMPKLDWGRIHHDVIYNYTSHSEFLLQQMEIPTAALSCKDCSCSDNEHISQINEFYCGIIDKLSIASRDLCKQSAHAGRARPGWNDYAADFHNAARESFLLWRNSGKPRHGYIFDLMTRTRARFKYALKGLKRKEDTLRRDALANKLLKYPPEKLWKEIRHINSSKSSLPCSIEGVTGNQNIAEMWKNHFVDLFNCLKKSTTPMSYNVEFTNDMLVTGHEIARAIVKLDDKKSCGLDGIYAEHLKHASDRLSALLALCFTACFVHGFLPDTMLSVVLIPLIKDKTGKINSRDNYRPIALASVVSKVLEVIILDRLTDSLLTEGNQFGFKKKLGTDSCIYVLKEIIDKYRCLNGSVFMCFLDASKAFDRVNHETLFNKLCERGAPSYITRLLAYWYNKQAMCVSWGGVTSTMFNVSNGVRQGGILSPYLFNVYMDDLSVSLNNTLVGCITGEIIVNHLMYADDLILISPSATGLRSLLRLCSKYGRDHDIKYNSKKSAVMISRSKAMSDVKFAPFEMNGEVIPEVKECKYLGHYLVADQRDDRDILRQCQFLYAQANMLTRKFHMCSLDVKIELFKTYCSSFYTSQLWWNYTQSAIRKLHVAYNNAFRMFFNLPRDCSASGMLAENRVYSSHAIIRNLSFRFMTRLELSNNTLIRSLLNSDIRWNSRIRRHWVKQIYIYNDVKDV